MNASENANATSTSPGHFDAASPYPAWRPQFVRSRRGRWMRVMLVLVLIGALCAPVAWSWVRLVQQVVPSSRTELATDLSRLQQGLDTQVFDPLQQALRD